MSWSGFRSRIKIFGRENRAVAAVEFALIAPIFFASVFCIVETSIDYYIIATLDGIVEQVSLPLQTGVPQLAGLQSWQFKQTYVCPLVKGFLNCSNLIVNIQSNFGNAYGNNGFSPPPSPPLSDSTFASYCPGSGGYSTTVTISYPVSQITGIWSSAGTSVNGAGQTVRIFQASVGFILQPTFTVTPTCTMG